ncbi:ATP-binding protein [Polyangium aurulentum]|uniref:ATP-binding protein n=1 Tax=Polyangium aurulentum TaxID=2567896 RepID=UPI0010AEC783|nr:ATP-binding protein [Polyangium aurulentum]UQA59339.1 MASE1 domain-containing protein [Polyangium aurulentum]
MDERGKASWRRTLGAATALCASYFFLAGFGLRWATFHGAASSVFPAAGVALAGLLLGGLRLWPAVFIARLAVSLVHPSPLPLWAEVAIAAGNTLAAVAAAGALRRAGWRPSLPRLDDVLAFLAAAFGCAAVAAAIGAGVLSATIGGGLARAGAIWIDWCAGDLSGALVVAPLVLTWAPGEPLRRDRAWWLHLLLSSAVAGAGTWMIYGPLDLPLMRPFAIFPVLLWAALACGVRGAATAMLPVAVIAIWGTTLGYGAIPLTATPMQRFVLLQEFIVVAAISTLVLAVVADERRGKVALRESEARLRESENRYRAFVASSSEGVYRLEFEPPMDTTLTPEEQVERTYRDGRFAECNLAFARMYGFERCEDVVGRGLDLMLPPDDPDARVYLRSLIEGGYSANDFESVERDKLGRTVHFTNSIMGVVEEGKLVRVWGIQRDITDRKMAEQALREKEERLRLASEAAGIGYWSFDAESQKSVLDATCAALFGLEPGVPVPVEHVIGAIHPDDRAHAQEVIGQAIMTTDRYEIEFRTVLPDGTTRWVAGFGISVHEPGKPVRLAGVNWDITARKAVEMEREQLLESERAARTEAERASRLKDEFLSTVSHELRTPLNAILGWSQILGQRVSGKDKDLEKGIAVIDRNARAQVQLIEDLLDMGRIISGKVHLEMQTVDLHDVVAAALSSAAPSAAAKGIELEKLSRPGVGTVRGDPNRLQQVVWNLLSNAIKFTPKGGRVKVTLVRVDGRVEMAVEDAGQGIAPEFLPYVFERFRQADGSISRKHGGLGLGLSIVKNLVELHGGTVRAMSAGEGKGATFTVELPLAIVHLPAGASASGEEESADLSGISVLFVDDAQDNHELVRRFLEDRKARVRTAGSGQEALGLLERERPDVIVSDIGMPGMDGYELIRRVRALPPEQGGDVPALALTAFARAEDRNKALLAGFQAHLSKPVQPAELTLAIGSLTGRGARRAEAPARSE